MCFCMISVWSIAYTGKSMCVCWPCSCPYLLCSADLTEVCDMEEDRAYIAKKCAELRGQFDHLVKIARDALAMCHICEHVRQLQHCNQQHRFVYS